MEQVVSRLPDSIAQGAATPSWPHDSRSLATIVGEAATIALAEVFGGTRLYVPARVKPEHPIVGAIGAVAAQALCERFGPGAIRVPLAREIRAVHYRAEGSSNAKIAVRLGLTEGGVSNLFKRLKARANAGQADSAPRSKKRNAVNVGT